MSELVLVEKIRKLQIWIVSCAGAANRDTLVVFGGFFDSDGVSYRVVRLSSERVRDRHPSVPREG